MAFLEQSGERENTIIVLVSDNGASGEGGPNGSVNENKFFNGIPDSMEENLQYLDELGSPATYNHYPVGWAWAFNAPFKMWKRYNFEGGVADPLVISWPKGIKATGEIRHQFCHATGTVEMAAHSGAHALDADLLERRPHREAARAGREVHRAVH